MALKANRREIARILGVAENTVVAYIDRGMPVEERGMRGQPWVFDVSSCVAWKIDLEVAAAAGPAEETDYAEAERRAKVADAALKEIELAERRRQVVRIQDVESLWRDRILRTRERIRNLGAKLAPEIIGETDLLEIERTIDAEGQAILEGLSEYALPEEEGDGEAPAASAAARG